MPFKLIGLLLFGLFGVVLTNDVLVVTSTYERLEKTMNQSIDSAIIAASKEEDYQFGEVRVDEMTAYQAGRQIFIDTLSLDSNLVNDHYKDSEFDLFVTYTGNKPRIEAEFRTSVDVVSGKILGLPTYPISVKKKTPYLVNYK